MKRNQLLFGIGTTSTLPNLIQKNNFGIGSKYTLSFCHLISIVLVISFHFIFPTKTKALQFVFCPDLLEKPSLIFFIQINAKYNNWQTQFNYLILGNYYITT
jgi:hypothetical protein